MKYKLKGKPLAITKEDVRALAKIVNVDKVIIHPNADKLDIAVIGGWQCIVKREEFKEGQLGLYFEIDSLLPLNNPLFEFLQARTADVKTDEDTGISYSRVRTIKLRKELSQGLLLPIPEDWGSFKEGDDCTERLGILKYVSNQSDVIEKTKRKRSWIERLKDKIQGFDEPTVFLDWPAFLKKSDQERIQNLPVIHQQAVESGEEFEVTVKLNGSSVTFYIDPMTDEVNICSRNNKLRLTNVDYTFIQSLRLYIASWVWRIHRFFTTLYFSLPTWKKGLNVLDDMFVLFYMSSNVKKELLDFYEDTGRYLVLQGELIGPGINSNKEGVEHHQYYIYSVYEINITAEGTDLKELLPDEARRLTKELNLRYVPVVKESTKLPTSIKDILKGAEGKAAFDSKRIREGVVYKSRSRLFSFKVISNKYLLKEEE